VKLFYDTKTRFAEQCRKNFISGKRVFEETHFSTSTLQYHSTAESGCAPSPLQDSQELRFQSACTGSKGFLQNPSCPGTSVFSRIHGL